LKSFKEWAKGFGQELQGTFESIEREQELRNAIKLFFALCEKYNHSNGLNFINDVLNFF
jgi:hypothetical protein